MAATIRSFRYKILDEKGKTVRGTVELPFDEVPPAVRYLERQGGTVLSVQTVPAIFTIFTRLSRAMTKITRKEIAEILNNLSMLLSAGVPVLTSLHDVLEDIKNPALKQTLKFVVTDIESGQTFSEAIQRHEKVFSPLIQNMCRIGEETGQLDNMLKKSGDHLLHLDEIIGSTKRALMYPSFLGVVVIGASAFWFMFVVPMIVSLFTQMNIELPFTTRLLIMISDWFANYFVMTLGSAVGAVLVLQFLTKKFKRLRYARDMVMLHMPVIRSIIETSLIARVSEYLGIMLAAGIGVLRTLEIITGTVSNAVYEKRLGLVQEEIRAGQTLSNALRATKAMHPFAVRMIAVGEQTGKMEEQTEYVASIYRDKLSALVEVLGKSLEPAMIVFLGLIFALVIAGVLMPVYQLMSSIK
jgi:type II secretory pathway component PulF